MKKLSRLVKPAPALALLLVLAACGRTEPVLYPNDHLAYVGQDGAQQDIAECRHMAETAGANQGEEKAGQMAGGTVVGGAVGGAAGAAGGAVLGAPGTGAAVGAATGAAAGFMRGLFKPSKPSQAYRNFVNRCLADRGYEVVGWD
jgi:predicted small lipoprotein YifL